MLILRKEGVMKQRSLETHRFLQGAAIVAIGSFALGSCMGVEADKAPESGLRSDTMQSAEAPQPAGECLPKFTQDLSETHEDNKIDSDWHAKIKLVAGKTSLEDFKKDTAQELLKEAGTNAALLEALAAGTETEIGKDMQWKTPDGKCLSPGAIEVYGEVKAKLLDANTKGEKKEAPASHYNSGYDPDTATFGVSENPGIEGDRSAVCFENPDYGFSMCVLDRCGNPTFDHTEVSVFPKVKTDNPPKPVTPPTPEQPQQPGPQPKGDTGVELPEGTQGKVDWNPSGYGHIGPETAVPAGPQVQNEGSSEWTYTPPASPQVTPGAPSNTAVAPGAEPAPAAPTPAPAPAITNEGIRLPDNQENDGDVDPDGN